MQNHWFNLFSFLIKTFVAGIFLIPLVFILAPVSIIVLPFYLRYEYKIRLVKINHRISEKQSKNPFKDENFETFYKNLIAGKNGTRKSQPN